VGALERLPGGAGIMADDAAAGLFAAALAAAGLYLTGQM
jgi:phosphatidylglycerophosphatase A